MNMVNHKLAVHDWEPNKRSGTKLSSLCRMVLPLSQKLCGHELVRKVEVQLREDQPNSVLANVHVNWTLQDGPVFYVHPKFPVPPKPNTKTRNIIYANLCTEPHLRKVTSFAC
jgi:hypothetical protein